MEHVTKEIFLNICTAIKEVLLGITVHSVQHLGWTTAAVAAILALTAIVFSQYNERNILKINEYDYLLRNETNDAKKIRQYISEITYLLKNNKIYEYTLALFKYVSYFIVFIWIIVIIGYVNDKSLGDIIIVILSTVLISIPFVTLPSILQKFNERNLELKIENNSLDYKDLERYWYNLGVKDFDLIKDIISPEIKIRRIEENIYFEFSNEILVSNLQVFVTGIYKNKVFKLSHIFEDDNKKYKLQLINPNSKVKDVYMGLFDKMLTLNKRDISVYLIPLKQKQNVISYKGTLIANTNNEIKLQIDSKTEDSFTDSLENKNIFFYSDPDCKGTYILK